MKLSNKGRYGVRAVFDIAFHNRGGATQIKEISERQGIPPRFLEQIFQDLKRAGLVSSKRGPKGGYQLAKEAEDIRVGDVVRAVEGPVVLTTPPGTKKVTGDPRSQEITEVAFAELAAQVEACFDAITIYDLCERGEEGGLHRTPLLRYVYSI
ncbi:MAG: Rrf2 family transcriptional regulator [Deltaproteobacteria bacterium]|nr:MAG: Rrf2 family transcriptional regulator [Deltaproteobacteria bacterium]